MDKKEERYYDMATVVKNDYEKALKIVFDSAPLEKVREVEDLLKIDRDVFIEAVGVNAFFQSIDHLRTEEMRYLRGDFDGE